MKGYNDMSYKKVSVQELMNILNNVDNIEEPIIIERNSKKDLIVINLTDYNELYNK